MFKRRLLPHNKSKAERQKIVPPRNKATRIDMPILLITLGLTVFGTLMIYSGSAIVAVKLGNEPYFYFMRQLGWVLVGLVAAYFVYKIDYHTLAKFSTPAMIVSIILLVVVLLVNQGDDIKRWIDLGFFDLQPSELAKLTFLLFISTRLSKLRDKRDVNKKEIWHHIQHELLPFLGWLLLVCGLIVIEPDMDTAIMLGATSFILYFLAGTDVMHTIGTLVTGLVSGLFVTLFTLSASYRLERFTTYLEFWKTSNIPDPLRAGYQFKQIMVAVASGGLLGVGFGASKQKYLYLGDTAFTDTIFAIFAEEFGLLGGVILVGIFVYFLLRGLKIAANAPDRLGFLIAASISIWITLTAFMHIGANVALLPINGNTLPFMSYGGSSTIINLMAVGLLLNVARFANFKSSESAREKRFSR